MGDWFLVVVIGSAVSVSDPLTMDECAAVAKQAIQVSEVQSVRCMAVKPIVIPPAKKEVPILRKLDQAKDAST